MTHALPQLIADYQSLNLPENSPSAALFERAIFSLLQAEGPPSQPIDNYSEGLNTVMVRSTSGRPLFMAHSWLTDPWVCLLLDTPPIGMGRPTFIPTASGRPRIGVPYRDQKFQRMLGLACQALDISRPPHPTRLCCKFSKQRLFIAWAQHQGEYAPFENESDTDNYVKNVCDGLQKSQIVKNDKGIVSLIAAKDPMPDPVQTLDDFLLGKVSSLFNQNPKTTIAEIRRELRIPVRRAADLRRKAKLLTQNATELKS